MRFSKKSILGALGALVVGAAAIVYAQTQFSELNDVVFRARNPQIRASGNVNVRDLAGTGVGALSHGYNTIVTDAATRTLTVSECGSIIISTLGSSTQTYTLPAVTNAGCKFTFITGHASGEVIVKTPTAVTCTLTSFAAVGADADTGIITDTSCEGGIKNTAATNAIGDTLTLVSSGTAWFGVTITSGIWASN